MYFYKKKTKCAIKNKMEANDKMMISGKIILMLK